MTGLHQIYLLLGIDLPVPFIFGSRKPEIHTFVNLLVKNYSWNHVGIFVEYF